MTQIPEPLTEVARAIQLALAPVFLLTGVAGLLNVMTGRLSRIIDRGRALTERPGFAAQASRETPVLERRGYFVSIAITSCTIAALLLCMVVATLFVEALLAAPLAWVVGALFTTAMLALVVGLSCFLREVHMAMQAVRFGGDPHERGDPS